MSSHAEPEKKLAAAASLDHVHDGMLLGLGSGSTAEHMVRLLGERVKRGLSITAVTTSRRTRELAAHCGIPLIEFDGSRAIDLTIDGADEVDAALRLIKGGGGALLHEKIVAEASRRMIVIADSTKLVASLGRFPLPVEIVRFGWKKVAQRIESLGATVARREQPSGDPFVTDEGHFILDCSWGLIADPDSLASRLDAITGVVEHGLFLEQASMAIIGEGSKTKLVRRADESGFSSGI